LFLVLLLSGAALSCGWIGSGRQELELKKGDSVVFIGNTFAERMHLFGYFETFLHSKYPGHQLKVRNMGWSGDEPNLMPRPEGFGDVHKNLADRKADVIFACFGMNESFGGEEKRAEFKKNLGEFVRDLQSHQYKGQSAPRIVLVSPIAHEDVGGDLADGKRHNQDLQRYTETMAEVAAEQQVHFINLFTPTREWMSSGSSRKLTFNGIHLTEYGDWVVSRMMAEALGLVGDIKEPAGEGNAAAEQLRRVVYEKNYYFFIRWRGPNAEYIHGRRKALPGAEHLPEEMKEFDRIIGEYDRRIWAMDKPEAEGVWQEIPEGLPIWARTPEYKETGSEQARKESLGNEDRLTSLVGEEKTKREAGSERQRARLEVTQRPILRPEEAINRFQLPAGYEINLYASEQDFPIANPMAMQFDARGRLWVANTPTWPQPVPGERPQDSVIILEDTDRDGRADTHTVFADHLNMIHGFALDGRGGAYITQAPHLIHASDTDGDGRADDFEVVLHGFGTEDVEHSMNTFKWGPDGALYFMNGVFAHTQVETPYGPRRVLDAAVYRYEPDSGRFDVFISYPFADPWGQVFDRWGEQLILDASGGNYYCADMLSSNYVYPNKATWPNRGINLSFAPKETPPTAGFELLRSRHFPAKVQGRLLTNEFAHIPNRTLWWDLQEKGTTYELTQFSQYKIGRVPQLELIFSSDPLFRPIALSIGPDGALYVIDFSSPIVENTSFSKRDPGRDHSHGRIWRVTYKGRPLLEQPEIVGRSRRELLDLLKRFEEDNTRYFARRALQQREADDVVPALQQWIAALDRNDPHYEHHLLEGLWVYQGLNVVEADLLKKLLKSEDHRVRVAATRVLRFWQNQMDDSIQLLERLVEDEHPRVRLQAVLACGFSSSQQAKAVALTAAKHEMDPGLEKALDDTMSYFEEAAPRHK
ncbi:GDSL-type esterase/lipase family protein, partial [Acidobacteria bacterium AH-259-L09]|nr:GDSL-type esterase/lipase family protein [Acidobacteria bacterium AH-259-L09]